MIPQAAAKRSLEQSAALEPEENNLLESFFLDVMEMIRVRMNVSPDILKSTPSVCGLHDMTGSFWIKCS